MSFEERTGVDYAVVSGSAAVTGREGSSDPPGSASVPSARRLLDQLYDEVYGPPHRIFFERLRWAR